MANLYDFTERLKLLLYLNHRKSSVNTRHFDDNFQAVDDFARETDQKFVDQDTARNQLQSDLLEIIRTNKTAFDNHAADQSNPHAVTKLQVGLGKVDDTSDMDKPVSTAQAAAVKAVQDDVTAHKQDKDNPHGVTKGQVGLGNANNTSDLDKPVSTAQAAAIKTVQDGLDAHKNSKANPHAVTKSQVGLGNADNTSDVNKPVSTAQAAAIKAVQDDLTSHKGNTSNPHTVTKAQVGLGNVPNVATNDQTPSYTAATALAALVSGEKLSVAFGKLAKGITDLISHLANKSNPHGVTKAQIGLGSVDNTADKSKPVSTPQQDAIDAAMAQANAYTLQKIADLINGAPESMDTLKEVADAIAANEDVMDALNAAIGTKAAQAELDGHTGNTTIHITATERSSWNGAVNVKHSHANKALLDTYTQTEANLKSAVDNKHSHSNKSVIDGITSALVTAWNGAVNVQHSHNNKALLDSYTQTEANLASAVSTRHTHSNKAVIDKITQAMLDTWDTVSGKAAAVHKHVKADITDFPVSLKNPTALTLKLNGTAAATYDGSDAKEVNVTSASIGAAAASHSHSYLPLAGGTMTGNLTLKGAPTADLMAATKKYVDDLAASAGNGDMLKSVYDTNDNGIVDNADKVNNHTVNADVPANAKFTDTVYTHPTTSGNKHIPSGGASGQILRWSADGTAVWGADNNTTYAAFKAATASTAGGSGLVPAPAAGKQATFLRGDGQWAVPYTHPTVSGYMHIPAGGSSGQILRWSANGNAVWGEDNDTTYGVATQSANGLMAAADKKKLDGVRTENVIRNVTIATSAFVANTDENKAQYPYCADYTLSGMTATCWANVNLSAASKVLGVIEQGNTMAGKLRLYANAVPSADIVIDNIVWKEVG